MPGPIVATPTQSQSIKALVVAPAAGVTGSTFTVSGSELPANKEVKITWLTTRATWELDPRADSVDYLGVAPVEKLTVQLATLTTDAKGSFSVNVKAPDDFGGMHEINAVIDGVSQAFGAFTLNRSATISPAKGPIGTPFTITYHGLGSSLYEGGAAVNYDNHFTGAVMAYWTRGTAEVKLRASGPVGKHTITIADAITFTYMNVQQSPIPWATGQILRFTVTKDKGRPKTQMEWPVSVPPTLSARTTLQPNLPRGNATVTPESGPVGSAIKVSASGLAAAPVSLEWETVLGSRVNCQKSACWNFVSTKIGEATPTAGAIDASATVPDGLGGWHVVQLVQGGKVVAQAPFYIKRSIYGDGVFKTIEKNKQQFTQPTLVLKEGQPFTIHLKGLGWTQLDNTIAVDYDNSYIGYGCGFNSNGDTVMNLVATGGPGTHLIDMYPLLYTNQPAYANTPYGVVPVLTFAKDDPALALGYQLPAIRMAITVAKQQGHKKAKHNKKKASSHKRRKHRR